jgi:DnaJ-class molecular chaperone
LEYRVKDPYKTLGVRRDAANEDIRMAWKRLMFAWHPDKHPSSDEAHTRAAHVNAAYDSLKPDVRATTDAMLSEQEAGAAPTAQTRPDVTVGALLEELFERFLEGRPPSERPFWQFLGVAAWLAYLERQPRGQAKRGPRRRARAAPAGSAAPRPPGTPKRARRW